MKLQIHESDSQYGFYQIKKGTAKEISSTPLRITKTIEQLKDVRIDFQFSIQSRLPHYNNQTDAYFKGIGTIKANQCNIVRNFQTQKCNTLNSHNTNLAGSKQNRTNL